MSHLLSLKEYCAVKRPLNAHDLIQEAVNKEDWINHANEPIPPIPKLTYFPSKVWSDPSIFAFLKELRP